ncbi:MAG: hypothetical protein ABI759_06675 [Candidatus Solibacter sp.]
MPDVITEYQKWKLQGEDLRVQARQAMENRFRELLTEAAQIAEEFRTDFGATLKPPASITAFRYKATAKPKGKKPAAKSSAKAAPAKAEAAPTAAAAPAGKANPKVAGLQKKLATARKKLEDAKAGGATTRPYEDKVYELEDELRLAMA